MSLVLPPLCFFYYYLHFDQTDDGGGAQHALVLSWLLALAVDPDGRVAGDVILTADVRPVKAVHGGQMVQGHLGQHVRGVHVGPQEGHASGVN